MELLYRGFDGLDVSFQAHFPHTLSDALETAKAEAQKFRSDAFLEWHGIPMLIKESGARGGYAFTASTGMFGATWFFKKPNARDPWGVRVSCSSFQLALNGLGQTRAQLNEILSQLGIEAKPGSESIGRIDYAFDFLAPDFTLVPEQFVMYSNANRSDHIADGNMRVSGKSGRTTSVTVGKMPGRQVIIYDKRAEVITKHKTGWWEIWNAALAERGRPALDGADPTKSRVWRVELRAGKHHLKEDWALRTWLDLDSCYGDLAKDMLKAIRYVEPSSDSNRARWPDHQLWKYLASSVDHHLFELQTGAKPDHVKAIHRAAHDNMLFRQMLGLLISRAALSQMQIGQLVEFAQKSGQAMADEIKSASIHFDKKLGRAKNRYLALT